MWNVLMKVCGKKNRSFNGLFVSLQALSFLLILRREVFSQTQSNNISTSSSKVYGENIQVRFEEYSVIYHLMIRLVSVCPNINPNRLHTNL